MQLNELWDNCLTNYVYVISCTAMTYDFLLTVDREVMLVWLSPWSAVKVLFLVNRYTPFLSAAILLYPMIAPAISEKECLFVQDSTAWLKTVGMLVAEVILVIRTWAVYERQGSVGIGLTAWTTVIWVGCMTSVGIFLRSLLYEPVAAGSVGALEQGCHVVPGNNIVFVSWILFMVFEAVICSLMVYKSATAYRADRSTAMFKAVFRDGTMFYVYLLALSIANVATIFSAPADLAFVLSMSVTNVIPDPASSDASMQAFAYDTFCPDDADDPNPARNRVQQNASGLEYLLGAG
ncbi:hypothetical protein PsYK624_096630 [Phanerochaete sordida]|uniref:DUF6533 domain-containing protein n=1 Tax=Phanerochaete sordida TaxID=48140 RepID=A0A9P3LGC3_9APHY|nr:hypothetical protein PsYK624_096630 [Phanerochaete sordida]